MKTAVDIRALTLSDLNDIEEIEHRSYDTPWSRSMFAGELAKPASLCLGAFEGEQLGGYLIVSRYVDAWHIMNIAVSPDFRRRGVATALLERLFESTDDRSRRDHASAFAVCTPTSSAPIKPGPRVTATLPTSSSDERASASASRMTGVASSRCRREATSGTTPP